MKTPYIVRWTCPPRHWINAPAALQRPESFLVFDTPTISKEEHLRLLWLDWLDENPPGPVMDTSRPAVSPSQNNQRYEIKRRRFETHQSYEERKFVRNIKLRGNHHARKRRDPATLPPHRFVPWGHPYEACGPVYAVHHPRRGENPPWATKKNPDPAAVEEWHARTAAAATSAPLVSALPPHLRTRYAFRIPARALPGTPPEVVHVPPLVLVTDPDPARGLSAAAVALDRYREHAAPWHALAAVEGYPVTPPPARLPNGTTRHNYGPPTGPLERALMPRPYPSPWVMRTAPDMDGLDDDEPAPLPPPRGASPRGTLCRWSFQVPPDPAQGIPPLSLVLDDTARHTAHKTALHLWLNHARAHGFTGPAPRTLPRGTVKRYVGTTRHAPPLDEVPPPRLLVEPYKAKPRARRRTKAEMAVARAAARAAARQAAAANPANPQRVTGDTENI